MDLQRLAYFLGAWLTAGGFFFLLSDEPVTRGAIKGLDTTNLGLLLIVPGLCLLAYAIWRRRRG